jgi:hypothetical protein
MQVSDCRCPYRCLNGMLPPAVIRLCLDKRHKLPIKYTLLFVSTLFSIQGSMNLSLIACNGRRTDAVRRHIRCEHDRSGSTIIRGVLELIDVGREIAVLPC